jgi:hypothetical protein
VCVALSVAGAGRSQEKITDRQAHKCLSLFVRGTAPSAALFVCVCVYNRCLGGGG